ncbi:HDIG domain-containing protein [Thermaerobacter sp. PB12/4term]|uniref:HD domain-containing protein n=1 Tax=Thermaerobacter sp. PB12/4term TaxID=2293838 RepID=UPI000E32CA43|nr:HD domain-containing protein [Thermaerobacter sp. PB12/4term]QIA27319.1 HDIG domain-containing protein [Thermaerobacter sp. PB12/4term]
MAEATFDRQAAWQLLTEFTQSPHLIKHALGVEACMRYYARLFGEDEEKWGITGLLHDFDYDRYPSLEDHPFRGAEILRQRGWPEEIVRAILSHGDHTGVPRQTLMEKALYAVDELTGFVIACALVRPTGLADLTVQSVKKKFKDKAFARGVNREDVIRGAEDLGVPLDQHIAHVIEALRGIAPQLELAG